MEAEKLTAIAYIRVSSQRQVTDGNSLVVQRNLVARYAENRDLRIEQIFVEEAESAKTADRPVFQGMLAKLALGEVAASVLIIPKIDRLARNRDDYGEIKRGLNRLGVRIESCSESLEDTPAGRFTESMLASAAQFDNEVRAERSRDGMVQAVKEGRWVWRAPFGFKNVRLRTGKKGGLGTIAPNEPAASLMRKVFENIAAERQTVRQAQAWLEHRGVRIAHGNLYYLLKNPVYCGTIAAFGGEFEAKPPFVPLISREQFALVQTLIKKNPNLPTVYEHDNPEYPLRGCLRCEECRSFLTAAWSTGRQRRFAYYRCLSCHNMNLPRDHYEGEFVAELMLFKPDAAKIAKLKDAARRVYLRETESAVQNRKRISAELSKVTELRRQVALKTAAGIIPDEVGKEQMASLTAKIGKHEVELKETNIDPDHLSEALDFVGHFFERLPQLWKDIEVKAQKKLQSFFFPEGLIAEKNGSLRTTDYPLLEQVKTTLCATHYSLVVQTDEIPNEVVRFVLRVHQEFGDSPTLAEFERSIKRDEAA